MNQVEISGERRYIFFSIIGGYLANIGKILEVFHVSQRETVVFSLDNNILHARVYQEDGREIDYSKRVHGCLKNEYSNWIWAIDWNQKSGKNQITLNFVYPIFDLSTDFNFFNIIVL